MLDPVPEVTDNGCRRGQGRELSRQCLVFSHLEVEGGLGELRTVARLGQQLVHLRQVDLRLQNVGLEDDAFLGVFFGQPDVLGRGRTRLFEQRPVLTRLGEVDVGGGRFEDDSLLRVGEGVILSGGHRLGLADPRRQLAPGVDWELEVDLGNEGRERVRVVGVRHEELLHVEPALVEGEGEDLGRVVRVHEALAEADLRQPMALAPIEPLIRRCRAFPCGGNLGVVEQRGVGSCGKGQLLGAGRGGGKNQDQDVERDGAHRFLHLKSLHNHLGIYMNSFTCQAFSSAEFGSNCMPEKPPRHRYHRDSTEESICVALGHSARVNCLRAVQ